MSELRRHRLVFALLRPFCALFARLQYNYHWDSLKEIEGPYLLLSNHNQELDPILIGVSAWRQLYFVASEHLQRKGFVTKLLNYFLKPIVHQKGVSGATTVAKILRTLRSGSSVCLFPEGNRSFNGLTADFAASTGKMARRSGAKLVTYRLEGSYLTDPRWSMHTRKGHLYGRLVRVYTPEELQAMTDAEVNAAIRQDLWEDAYARQSQLMVPYRGKDLAHGLETTIFICPQCHQVGSLVSEGDQVRCSCGFHLTHDVYGYLHDDAGNSYTVTQLDQLQKTFLADLLAQHSEDALFSDTVTLQRIGPNHELLSQEAGTLTAFRDRLELCGTAYPLEALVGAAVFSRNVLILHTTSEHLEVRSHAMFSALKYQYLFQLSKEKAE